MSGLEVLVFFYGSVAILYWFGCLLYAMSTDTLLSIRPHRIVLASAGIALIWPAALLHDVVIFPIRRWRDNRGYDRWT